MKKRVNILVTGSKGQLGSEIKRHVEKHSNDFSFLFTDTSTLDISVEKAVETYVEKNEIDYIVNCAAYTAVDKAEDDVEKCLLINRDAAENLGKVALKHDAKVIHISTDYVFDGTNTKPYTESDVVSPESVYGKSKLEGENLLLKSCPNSIVIRTSWLYSIYGNNFVKTMIKLGQERDSLNVVADQTGTPTNAADLAQAIIQIIIVSEKDKFKSGIYHYSNEGVTTWYDFTLAIHKSAKITNCNISPITTDQYPTRAKRPQYSVLDKTKIKNAFALIIPKWNDSLDKCIKELNI